MYKPYIKVSGAWQKLTIDWTEVENGPTDLADLVDDSTHRTVTDAEKATWNNASSEGGGLSLVWAEENAAFNVSTGFQWAFGNGANSDSGCVIPFDCDIIALGLSSTASATGTVELYKNYVATGETISLSAETDNHEDITYVSITAGDRITFRTTAGSDGSELVVSAVLASSGAIGADGATGAEGPPGLTWKGTWVTSTPYVENDVVEVAGSTYICTNDVTGSTTPPNDTSNWDLFVSKGADDAGSITKADVEGVLTGEISTHTHASSGGGGEYASFYLSTGGASSLAGTETTLVLNSTSVNSNTGVFGLASNQVTIDKTANFQMEYHVSIESGGTARTSYEVWLEKNAVEVPGTRSCSYQRGYNDGDTATASLIISVTTGDVFQLRINRANGTGSTGLQNSNGTGLTFIEM